MGAYRVLPLGSAERSGANVLMEAAQWQDRPEYADSVWMMVQTREQWRQAQEKGADVVVWRVGNAAQAAAVDEVLKHGVSVPLVVAADVQTASHCGGQWLAAGAHAVLADEKMGDGNG